jgi:hypothetical protein
MNQSTHPNFPSDHRNCDQQVAILENLNIDETSLVSLDISVFSLKIVLSLCDFPTNNELQLPEGLGDYLFIFRGLSDLSLSLEVGFFPNPFLDDGSFSAANLDNKALNAISIERGKVVWRNQWRGIDHRAVIEFANGLLKFSFIDLEIKNIDYDKFFSNELA